MRLLTGCKRLRIILLSFLFIYSSAAAPVPCGLGLGIKQRCKVFFQKISTSSFFTKQAEPPTTSISTSLPHDHQQAQAGPVHDSLAPNTQRQSTPVATSFLRIPGQQGARANTPPSPVSPLTLSTVDASDPLSSSQANGQPQQGGSHPPIASGSGDHVVSHHSSGPSNAHLSTHSTHSKDHLGHTGTTAALASNSNPAHASSTRTPAQSIRNHGSSTSVKALANDDRLIPPQSISSHESSRAELHSTMRSFHFRGELIIPPGDHRLSVSTTRQPTPVGESFEASSSLERPLPPSPKTPPTPPPKDSPQRAPAVNGPPQRENARFESRRKGTRYRTGVDLRLHPNLLDTHNALQGALASASRIETRMQTNTGSLQDHLTPSPDMSIRREGRQPAELHRSHVQRADLLLTASVETIPESRPPKPDRAPTQA